MSLRLMHFTELIAQERARTAEIREGLETTPEAITLTWGGYPYEIAWDRIRTERDLLAWTLHLAEKEWMTRERIHCFIEVAGRHRGLSIYGTP